MSLSADQVQIGIVKESAYGITPSNPVFEILPLTGESIVAEVSSQSSNLMTADRQIMDLITTSIAASGSIETELAITPAMEILIESAFAESLVNLSPAVSGLPPAKETMIGKTQISFTIEKRFPDPATPGSYLYHRIAGCVCNTASMSVAPEDPATISFGIIGKEMVTSSTELTGSTYLVPANPIVLRGPDTITLDVKGLSVAVNCFGNFGWDLNNNYRGILCLGHLGNKSVAIGRADVTVNATVYFSSNALLDTLLAQSETSLDFAMASQGDPISYFAAHFPRVKFSQDNVVAGGTGEDVIDDLAMQALFNSAGTKSSLGLNDADHTSMRVVLGTGAPTAAP